MRRVRVINEPASAYIRFEAAVVPMQQEAGEEFRYLSRDHPVARDLPDRDFWIFDGRLVLVLNFAADGRPTAHELHDDPETARWYAGIRDTAWPAATPYDQYAPNLQ